MHFMQVRLSAYFINGSTLKVLLCLKEKRLSHSFSFDDIMLRENADILVKLIVFFGIDSLTKYVILFVCYAFQAKRNISG
jgi:hypothetical protein